MITSVELGICEHHDWNWRSLLDQPAQLRPDCPVGWMTKADIVDNDVDTFRLLPLLDRRKRQDLQAQLLGFKGLNKAFSR